MNGSSPDLAPASRYEMPKKKNLLVGLLLGFSVLGLMFWTYGYENTWKLWGFPVASPPFMDVRVITDGAESFRHGFDPLQENPFDCIQRRVNYPRIWQSLYRLGVGQDDFLWLGALFGFLFIAGLSIAIPPLRYVEVFWMLAAVFSPAMMLGLERGNTDLPIFFLLALAIATSARSTAWPLSLTSFAFMLKLYPVLGLVVLLRRGRQAAVGAIIIGAAFALLYLAYTYNDLALISAATPRETWLSFGLNVLWMKVAAEHASLGANLKTLSWAVALATLLCSMLAWWFRKEALTEKEIESPRLDAFRMGAACYVSAYFIGNNFDYRLMLLLFTIPQLLTWAGERAGGLVWTSRIMLVALFVSLWSILLDQVMARWPQGPWISFLIGEAAHWVLFCSLVYLLFRTMPGWVSALIRSAVLRTHPEETPAPSESLG